MFEVFYVVFQLQADVPLGDSTTDVTYLLAPDLMPKFMTRPPPEMAACQTLVLAFVDALKKQELQVTSFKEAIQSHKRHVSTLKQELSSACQREYGEEVCCNQGTQLLSTQSLRNGYFRPALQIGMFSPAKLFSVKNGLFTYWKCSIQNIHCPPVTKV